MGVNSPRMAYPIDPATIYDEIIEERNYCPVNGTEIPIRESVIDKLAEHVGETELQVTRPDGTSYTLNGDGPIPPREDLLQSLLAAQRGFNNLPITTITNLFEGRLGPLHYTDTTAHFTVSDAIFNARPQRGTEGVPEQFRSFGVKAAHLLEGYEIATNLPYHWVDDLGWEITQREYVNLLDGAEIPENRAPPVDECFIINVPIVFPAGSFGRTTLAPSTIVNSAIKETERSLDTTLLTQRMAQIDAIETHHSILQTEMDRGLINVSDLDDVDTVLQNTFNITDSGLASLRSQVNTRRRKAFETVRQLSKSDDFNYVMEEFAETIDELGELAMLGTRYREEVLGEPPGFY